MMIIKINNGGEVFAIHHGEVDRILCEALGVPQTERVSHVEPINSILQWAFHAIRRRVSDESRTAQWTRSWLCQWRVRILSDGPTLAPFSNRQDAIAAEVEWLKENRI